MLVQPLSHRRRRAYNIRDRCIELSEFREEATAPTAAKPNPGAINSRTKSKHDPLDGI